MKSLPPPSTSPGFISLATKLAVGLCVVLLSVSSAVSVWLTEHEGEDLLRSKQRSVEAIADAYAISLAVPLENGSVEDATELFRRLTSNADLSHAAIWRVNEQEPIMQRGAISADLLSVKPDEPARDSVQLTRDHVRVARVIRTHNGEILGFTVLHFSLEAETRAFSSTRRSIFIFTVLLTLVTSGLVVILVRILIGEPLRKLVEATEQLHGGSESPKLTVGANDEIGRLSAALNTMAESISDRENKLQAANLAATVREERFRRLTENASDILYRLTPPDFRFDYVSRALFDLTGVSRRTLRNTPEAWTHMVHPDDREIVEVLLRSPLDARASRFSVRLLRPDGGIVWTEHVIMPVFDENGMLVAVEGIARDTTEKKEAQEARAQSDATFRALIESSPDVIAVLRNGLVVYANPAAVRVLGNARNTEGQARPFSDFIHPDDRSRMDMAPESARPDAWQELRLLGVESEVVFAEVALMNVLFDGSSATLVIAHDVTERNRLRAQLMQADRMASMGLLAAGVAHEINNPLTYVLSNLAQLQQDLTDASASGQPISIAEHIPLVREAQEGAQRVRRIVRDLRDFTRSEDSNEEAASVAEVLETSIAMASNQIRHKARLVKDYEDVPKVRGDRARLGQVFLNLLVNAAQALPDGAADTNEIRVALRMEASKVVVEITDTGPGIPLALKERVFEPFFTTKPVGVGTGLGLFICHRIVTSLGGRIEAHDGKNGGAVFRIELAAAEEMDDVPAVVSSTVPSTTQSKITRVLVCDDEVLIAVAFRRMLRGKEVTCASSGREALEKLTMGTDFDVVFCDLMMPESGGIDVYETISKLRPGFERRIVFMTGGAFTDSAKAFLDRVPNVVIEKPFTKEEVLAAAARILHQEAGATI